LVSLSVQLLHVNTTFVWVHVHGAELACAYAPSAAVAGVFVYADYSGVAILF
jgi:hypothetical protein